VKYRLDLTTVYNNQMNVKSFNEDLPYHILLSSVTWLGIGAHPHHFVFMNATSS
jgi:hypothetical protein